MVTLRGVEDCALGWRSGNGGGLEGYHKILSGMPNLFITNFLCKLERLLDHGLLRRLTCGYFQLPSSHMYHRRRFNRATLPSSAFANAIAPTGSFTHTSPILTGRSCNRAARSRPCNVVPPVGVGTYGLSSVSDEAYPMISGASVMYLSVSPAYAATNSTIEQKRRTTNHFQFVLYTGRVC